MLVLNVALFFAGYNATTPRQRMLIDHWMLQPQAPQLHQFFSCMFLHADTVHLLGNMVFLWVFGSAVNDKLGHAGYAAFYLAGGVIAGVGYVLLSGVAPALGASGAIAAVTGAFLVLFPRVRVTLRNQEMHLLESAPTALDGTVTFKGLNVGQYVIEVRRNESRWELELNLEHRS